MLNVLFSTIEFLFFHVLITIMDRISRLPRHSTPPELMRLYRENIALKSQVRALVLELDAAKGIGATVSMRTRIDIETIRRRRLVRRSFAHGLLNSYTLTENQAA